MTQLYYQLKTEQSRLQKLIAEKESSIAAAPDESLRFSCAHQRIRIFRKKAGEEKWSYVKASEKALAAALAQADYDRKVLPVLKKKLSHVQRLVALQEDQAEENIFWNLHPERRDLIVPTVPVVERIQANWNAITYRGKSFAPGTPEIYTDKGERVRSKSEKIIAEKLSSLGIPYKYEYPVQFQTYVGYADFYVLNKYTGKTFYYEHFGKMDDDGYMKDAVKRIRDYERIGVWPGAGLIMTFETTECVISSAALDWICRRYFLSGQPALPTEHVPKPES